jgi:cell division protein FtsB
MTHAMLDATPSPISANARSERRSPSGEPVAMPGSSGQRSGAVSYALLALLLLLLFAYLQGQLWAQAGPIRQGQVLRAAIEQQQVANALLKARNDALEAEVLDLKSGLSALEERARSELGLIRHGEVFYQLVRP